MPEELLKKWKEKIPSQWKICFFSAVIVGLLAHLYKITGWLPNWDSLVFRYDPQNMISLGRWFLPVVAAFSSFYDLPFLNGLMCIFFHGLGAVCIAKLFDVKKGITAALLGAITVTFPTVVSIMMYSYVAEAYGFAFFLSTLACLFMVGEKPKYYVALILIALSTGIYQAYLTVTVTLLILYLVFGIVQHGFQPKDVLKKGFPMLVTGLLGCALYYGILNLLLRVLGLELLDYQGVSSTLQGSSFDLAASLYTVKETFLHHFFDFSNGFHFYHFLNILTVSLSLLIYIKDGVQTKLFTSPLRLLFTALLLVCLFPGATILAFLNAHVDYHNLMRMGFLTFYLFFLLLYERDKTKGKKHVVRCWAVLGVTLLIISNQVVTANVSYHKAQLAYEKSYGMLIRIADRIDETEGTADCKRLLVVGALENSDRYSADLNPEITGITDGYILRADDESVKQSILCSALNDYCNKEYTFLGGEEKSLWLEKSEVKEMNVWPQQGCIAVIDDTLVIKLSGDE